MKVICSNCKHQVPAAQIDLGKGWAACPGCNDIFPLCNVVPGFPSEFDEGGKKRDRPADARAILERGEEELIVHLPAEGMRAATWGLLGFSAVWLGFITFWTAGALGILGGRQPGPVNWAFGAFSLPFWFAGAGMLSMVLWKARGTRTVWINPEELVTGMRCLGWSKMRHVQREKVQRARPYRPETKREGEPFNGVEIVYEKGSFVLPTDSRDEESWLAQEINEFLKLRYLT